MSIPPVSKLACILHRVHRELALELTVDEELPHDAVAVRRADALRHLSPRYVARKWIHHATRSLRAALQAVGDSAPTEEEAKALQGAERLLNAARDELTAGHPRRAVEAAKRSLRLSSGVIKGRDSDSG